MTVVTTKGQIVIPSKIRKRLNIKKGTRLGVLERGGRVVLQPLTSEYFENIAGISKTHGHLTHAILQERAKEKDLEDRKWSRS
jgi:AbrB family looped-hinge helix DNA binding protein